MSTQRQCQSKKLHWCQRGLTEPHVPENRKSELSKSSTLPIFTYQALYKYNNSTWHLTTPPKTAGNAVSNRGSRRLCTRHDLSSIPFCNAVNTPSAFAAKGKTRAGCENVHTHNPLLIRDLELQKNAPRVYKAKYHTFFHIAAIVLWIRQCRVCCCHCIPK